MVGRAVKRMKRIDWIVYENEPEEKNIEEWTTELKKSLRGGGIIKNRENVERILRQRFPLRKGNCEKDALRLMTMGKMLFNIHNNQNNANSYIKAFQVVKFSNKHHRQAGDINMKKKDILLLEQLQ
jgi:hypothetical protein